MLFTCYIIGKVYSYVLFVENYYENDRVGTRDLSELNNLDFI